MKYETWSLGYWFLKQYMRFANWLILKKTVVTGKDKIPANKPIVFAPNHQNALNDPMAVLLNTRYQPVWLARADIFGKYKAIDIILRFMKIIPVYRLRDGRENLEKNTETFSASIKVLENNSALALFPEAAHTFRNQMMPHKKAVPRIVFMAEEQSGNKLDIQIIPTGIYYSHFWKYNRTLIVNFGAPIRVNDYMEAYRRNPNAAIMALKTKIHDAILPLIINIKSKQFYEDFERIREMYGRHFLTRQNKKFSPVNLFNSDQLLVCQLDKMEAKNYALTEQLVGEANNLYKQIRSLGLRTWLIYENEIHAWKTAINIFLLLTRLPLFIFGFLVNAVPFFVIDRFVRFKIKDKSFWSSFFLVGGIIIFPLFYIILFLSFSWMIPLFWQKIAFVISLPFSGKLAFKWYIFFRKTVGTYRLLRLKWHKPGKFNDLIETKNRLFNQLDTVLPSN